MIVIVFSVAYNYTKYKCLVFLKNFLFLCLVDDIEVMFYEIEVETGKKTWEAGGVFAPTDVHRQVLFSVLISEHNLMAEWRSRQVSTVHENS